MIVLFIGLLALMLVIIGYVLDKFFPDEKFIRFGIQLAIIFISACIISLIIKYLGS